MAMLMLTNKDATICELEIHELIHVLGLRLCLRSCIGTHIYIVGPTSHTKKTICFSVWPLEFCLLWDLHILDV